MKKKKRLIVFLKLKQKYNTSLLMCPHWEIPQFLKKKNETSMEKKFEKLIIT